MELTTTVVILVSLVQSVWGQTPGQQLQSLATDFQNWRLQENPETATTRGIYKYNDKLSNFNYTRYNDYLATVNTFYERLKNISESQLSKADQVTFKVLESHFTTYIQGYQWRYYKNLNPINFLEGLLRDVERFPSSVPVDTKGDVENYIRRLQAYPQQIDAMLESMRMSMAYNTTNHKFTMDRLSPMFNIVLNISGATVSSLYIPFNLTVDGNSLSYSDAERQQVMDRAVAAVEAVLNKIEEVKEFFENEYVTRSEIGVGSFPRGDEYYNTIIKWFLSLNLTAQEIHDTGLQEVNRIASLMEEIMERQEFSGTIREYFTLLMNDTSNFYPTEEALLDGYRAQIADIDTKMSQLFHDLPGLPVVVRPMTTDGPQGTYSRGTIDGSTPGTFWANALRPGDIPKFGMMALTIHETNPGHHHQISLAMASPIPEFRRSIVYDYLFEAPVAFATFSSYSEGWALYAEGLGEEMGLYKDDLELMGRYSSEIFRACRLVVDTGIHYFNWDRERAINYVLNYTAFTRATAETEIDRYITWPGQALTYKIGEMKILELREKAKQTLGSNFDLRDFHRVVLENGRLPLKVLEEQVEDWLANYRPTTPAPPCNTVSSGGSHTQVYALITTVITIFISVNFCLSVI